MATTGLKCPKCAGEWNTREHNGVVIEECAGCQGVFLDRGELERIIEAETEYLAKLEVGSDGDPAYHGRHRRGIMHQIFTPTE